MKLYHISEINILCSFHVSLATKWLDKYVQHAYMKSNNIEKLKWRRMWNVDFSYKTRRSMERLLAGACTEMTMWDIDLSTESLVANLQYWILIMMGIYCDYSNTDFLHPPCTPVDQGQQGCAPLCTPPLNPPLKKNQHRGWHSKMIGFLTDMTFYYIADSKILKIHSKTFFISSLVKISITWSFPAINFVFSKWRCL